MDRVKTGIKGLDKLIEGGFPRGRSILVSGGCGTGKTIFALQFLYHGAKEYNEPGVYVTLDERPDLVREDMLKFGWDLNKLESQNLLAIVDGTIARIGLPAEEEFALPVTGFDLDKLILEIMRIVRKTGAKRLVIDSVPALGFNFDNANDVRKAILKLSYMLMRVGVTSILVSEVNEGENKFGKYGVEEYVVDGVIMLHYMGVGTQSNRTLHIRKMRSTKHSEELHPIEITSNGIAVHRIEEEYEKV